MVIYIFIYDYIYIYDYTGIYRTYEYDDLMSINLSNFVLPGRMHRGSPSAAEALPHRGFEAAASRP